MKKKTLPSIFDNIFQKTDQIHGHETRLVFKVPLIKKAKRQSTVRYQGPIIGNYIYPRLNMLKNSCALITYKNRLRKYLLANKINL